MSVRQDYIDLLSGFSLCACLAHLGFCPFNQLTSWILSGLSLREYPDFYQKLYGLLDPSIFHVKYRARFFHLADLFLSSS